MFELIKKIFLKKINPKKIDITTYPDKIVVTSLHQIKNSYWINSAEIEILEINSSNELIGKIIRKQLLLSKYRSKEPTENERKERREKSDKILKFKSIKESMQNSRHISISELDEKIIFSPSKNGGSVGKNRGYIYLKENIEIRSDVNYEILGETYRNTLEKCQ